MTSEEYGIWKGYNQGIKEGIAKGRIDAIKMVEKVMLERYNRLNSRGKHYCEEYFKDVLEEVKEQTE